MEMDEIYPDLAGNSDGCLLSVFSKFETAVMNVITNDMVVFNVISTLNKNQRPLRNKPRPTVTPIGIH
jgi:hypothetical protein